MTDPRHSDVSEPLLVRRYLHSPVRGGAVAQTDVRWPAATAAPVAPFDEPPIVFPAATPTVYGTPVRPRRRPAVLVAAGAVAVAGLAAGGYVLFAPADSDERAPMIAGAAPRVVPSPSPSEGALAAPDAGTAEAPATDPTRGTTEKRGEPADRDTPEREAPAETRVAPADPPSTSAPATGATRNPLLLAPPPPQANQPAARSGRIVADDGRCLDLFANNPADGNRIQVFTCNDTTAQTFTIATDGTLRVRDKCADATRRAAVRIDDCADRGVTRWRVGDNGTLASTSTGRCLTRPPAGRESVQMTRCSGTAAQRWTLPR